MLVNHYLLLVYSVLTLVGTSIWVLKPREKVEFKERPHTKLQFSPYIINLSHAILMIAAFLGFGIIQIPEPYASVVSGIGMMIFVTGFAFGIWASRSLGKNLIPDVGVKKEHTLTTTGAFGQCRHPIYLATIVMWLGSAIVFLSPTLFAGVVVVSAVQTLRAVEEEKLLVKEFGSSFDEYRKNVPALFPKMLGCERARNLG